MRARQSTLLIAAGLTVVLSRVGSMQSQPAVSWPGLWGPARNGAAVAGRTPKRLRELWRHRSAGGYSEVVSDGSRAFTMELKDGVDYVVAFDAQSGRERWRTRVAETYRGHDGSHDGPISTPTIAGGDLFAFGPTGHLVALDAATGRERWRHRTYDGSLVRLGDHLLLLGRGSGELRVIRASPDGYSELMKSTVFTPGATSITGPSVAGDRIFLRNVEEIVALQIEGGA